MGGAREASVGKARGGGGEEERGCGGGREGVEEVPAVPRGGDHGMHG